MLGLFPAIAGAVAKNLQAYTSEKNAGSGVNYNTGGSAWADPNYVTASDDNKARCTIPAGAGTVGQFLHAKGFGFALPTWAIVDGIIVTVERRRGASDAISDATATSPGLKLLKAGAQVGSDKASASAWPSTDADAAYGGASDLWGTTWSAADINNAGFGVGIRVQNDDGASSSTAYIDRIKIKVYYRA